MNTTFEGTDALLGHYATACDAGSTWLVVVAHDALPYLIGSTEDGDVFAQGFQNEDDPSAEFIEEKGVDWWPVALLGAESHDSEPTDS